MDPQPPPVTYICGDCGHENTMRQALRQGQGGDAIQCADCGYRVLFKKRTRRIVQHEAR